MCSDRGSLLGVTPRRALEAEIVRSEPSEREQQNESNDCLRDGAVETPDSEAILLDHRETEREEKPSESSYESSKAKARETENCDEQVSRYPDGGDGDVVHDRKGTMIHDAAIPARVDVARLGSCDVVNTKRQ